MWMAPPQGTVGVTGLQMGSTELATMLKRVVMERLMASQVEPEPAPVEPDDSVLQVWFDVHHSVTEPSAYGPLHEWGAPKSRLPGFKLFNGRTCSVPDCTKAHGDPQVQLSFCQKCKDEAYCSRKCQKAHWSEHKGSCVEYGSAPVESS